MPSFEVGAIYRVRTTLVSPPKEKIILCVGGGFFLWFNTRARGWPGQLCVQPGECPEIIRECFLDCSRVTILPERELAAARYCGDADAGFLTRVVEEIEIRAIVMPGLHRKTVAANLRLKHPTIPPKK